jgi:tRNA pseudouridine13 synthase
VIEEVDDKLVIEWKGENIGKYGVYLLKKINAEHFETIREISSVLNTKIHYMGIKDTNAITYQIVYIDSRFKEVKVQEYLGKNFELKFIGFSNKKFKHNGNTFIITIDTSKSEELRERVKRIAEEVYIPAYIGYQRFGTVRPITHVIGKLLLQRRFCDALFTILGYPYLNESETLRKFRKKVMDNELKEALEILPKKFKQERILLKNYLVTGNCFKTLKASIVPLSFYAEAYQSYLFNKYLSRKIDQLKKSEDKDSIELKIPTYYGDCDETCKEIFIEEGIERDFFKLDLFKIKLKSFKRKAFMKVRKISIRENTIEFSLDRGMYASIVLREVLRGDPRRFT